MAHTLYTKNFLGYTFKFSPDVSRVDVPGWRRVREPAVRPLHHPVRQHHARGARPSHQCSGRLKENRKVNRLSENHGSHPA